MSRAAAQLEVPGTESPDRDPELHALGLELYALQSERMEATKLEKAKREEIAAALHARKQTQYDCDGVSLWLEPSEKVKVKVGGGSKDDEEEES